MRADTADTIVVTEAAIHHDAVALLAGYRLVYAGAKFTQDELVALCELSSRSPSSRAMAGSIGAYCPRPRA